MNIIFKYYQYLFYKLYTGYIWLHGEKATAPHEIAWFSLSFLLLLYVYALLIIFEALTGYGFDQVIQSKIIIITILTTFTTINYFVFIKKKKYIKVIKRFQNENEKMRIIGNVCVWLFIIFSLVINFVLVLI